MQVGRIYNNGPAVLGKATFLASVPIMGAENKDMTVRIDMNGN